MKADVAPPLTPARWRIRLRRMLLVSDAIVIGASSVGAYLLRNALGELGLVRPFANEVPVALAVLPVWLLILQSFGSYRPQYVSGAGEAVRRFGGATFAGVLILGFSSFLFNLQLSRLYVLFLFLLVFVLGLIVRVLIRGWVRRRRRRGELLQRVLLVGSDTEAREVAEAMRLDSGSGYVPVGYVDDELPSGSLVDGELAVVGHSDEILALARGLRAGLVVVSPTGVEPGTLRDITISLEASPIDIAVAPSLFQVVTRRVLIESVGNVPLLHVHQIRLTRGKALIKRTLDLAVAVILGGLTLPLMALAAVAVRWNSSGSALFRQRRVGKDGEEFILYKFRTMVENAQDRLRDVEHLNEVGHGFFKVRDDPRVTPVGRFLRKWSIDELPQLWNVLRGDMSMVGPRPPLPEEVEDYEPWQLRRLRVRPGITGIWQVSGRSHVPFEEAVRLDLFYIENWSLGFDLYLLAKTVPAVLGRTGAY